MTLRLPPVMPAVTIPRCPNDPSGLLPIGGAEPGGWHDMMRHALGQVTFLAGHKHKRFAKQICQREVSKVTRAQWKLCLHLAWRYRKQIPDCLVPPHDRVKLLPKWDGPSEKRQKRAVLPREDLASPQQVRSLMLGQLDLVDALRDAGAEPGRGAALTP